MSLRIRALDPRYDGLDATFPDEVPCVAIGRDAARCQVAFAPHEPGLRDVHCELRPSHGGWKIAVAPNETVRLNGRRAKDGERLPSLSTLEFADGLRLRLEILDGCARAAQRRHAPQAPRTPRSLHALARLPLAALAWLLAAAMPLFAEQPEDIASERSSTALHMPARAATLATRIAEREASIRLLIHRDAAGIETTRGTAFVVQRPSSARLMLATNAHLAEIFEQLEPGAALLARSPLPPHGDVVITGVAIHPAYQRWAALQERFRPLDPATGRPRDFVAAGDVALLFVAPEEEPALGAPLELASTDVARALRAGDETFSLGFPMEGIVGGGVDLERPQPLAHYGRIVAASDAFLSRATEEERRLVQHDLPTTGGASGSPLFDAEGRVIALRSAANFAFQNGQRIPLAVGVSYAQRIDWLHELLDGTADEHQAARDLAWAERFRQMRRAGSKGVVRRHLAHLERAFQQRAGRSASIAEIALEEHDLPPAAPLQRSFVVPEDGIYLIAVAADEELDLDLFVSRGGRLLVADQADDAWPVVVFEARAGSELVLGIAADAASSRPIRLSIYRAK